MIFIGARSVVCGSNLFNVPFARGGSRRVWMYVQAVVHLRDVNHKSCKFNRAQDIILCPI
jgi:hypothetical protein